MEEKFEDTPMRQYEAVNRRRTDNIMSKKDKRTNNYKMYLQKKQDT
jgi:hypothetical protein